jgi:hypothetical protein
MNEINEEESNRIDRQGSRRVGRITADGSISSEPQEPRIIDTQHRRVISPAESAAAQKTAAEVAAAESRLFEAKGKERRLQLVAQRLEAMPLQIQHSGRRISILKARLDDLNEEKLSDRMCRAYLSFAEEWDAKAREEFVLSGILMANVSTFRKLLEGQIQQEEAQFDELENRAAELRTELGMD